MISKTTTGMMKEEDQEHRRAATTPDLLPHNTALHFDAGTIFVNATTKHFYFPLFEDLLQSHKLRH